MKSSVEDEDLGSIGHNVNATVDSHKMRNSVKRRDILAELKLCDDFVVYENRFREIGTAVDDTVSDCFDLAHTANASEFGVGKYFNENLGCLRVICHRNLFGIVGLALALMSDGTACSDSFANTLCFYFFGFCVEQLIFKRAASCVYNKNVHLFSSD